MACISSSRAAPTGRWWSAIPTITARRPIPSRRRFVDDLILEEYAAVYAGPPPPVVARWTGTYASAKDRLMLMDRPSDALRIVLITSGTGASTSFAIAEETIADLYGPP